MSSNHHGCAAQAALAPSMTAEVEKQQCPMRLMKCLRGLKQIDVSPKEARPTRALGTEAVPVAEHWLQQDEHGRPGH